MPAETWGRPLRGDARETESRTTATQASLEPGRRASIDVRSSRLQPPLQPPHAKVSDQRQNCCWDRSCKDDSIVDHRQSAENELAQAAGANRRGNRREPD